MPPDTTPHQSDYRSIGPQYVQYILREYENWTLLLSDNQNYLGRTVVWLVRPGGMQRWSNLSRAELMELQDVTRDAEHALDVLWHPDHMNYAWMGNLIHQHGGHGHMHLIPRYARSREYHGRSYDDRRWGQNYAPCDAFIPDGQVLAALCGDFKKALAA